MKKRKKTIIWLILGIICIITIILVYAIYIEPRQLTCQYVTLTVPKLPDELDGLTFGVVSDLHLRPSVMRHHLFDKMFKTLDENQPDFIFILGDIMNRLDMVGNLTYPEITEFLKKFHAPYGVYAVGGNHDNLYFAEGLYNSLEEAKIRLLEDCLINVEAKGTRFQLAGVNNYYERYANLNVVLKDVDSSKFLVLLSHDPNIFYRRENIADVTISGHTHGGQVRVPFLLNSEGAIFKLPYPFLRGVYRVGDRFLALTSGVGTSFFEIRFGRVPEIMIVTLAKRCGIQKEVRYEKWEKNSVSKL